MAELFIDTSGWASLFEKNEPFHRSAQLYADESFGVGDRFITANLILIELTALLTSPLRVPRPRQIQLLVDLRRDPSVVVVSIDPALERESWKLWSERPDKVWTLVDCSSFVVMAHRKLERALTTDHHFEQAGFVRLLK